MLLKSDAYKCFRSLSRNRTTTEADQLMEDTAEFGREITQDSKAALLAHLPRGLTWPQIHEIMQEPYSITAVQVL
ncbi:hypothetical protein DPMN_022157 [Dreissena polymorpha]|uniref:Uncharacterized protein n=1 Tax=Dreissena polymorpha TaxID=45954 RepID=A0A9D4F4W7_DREPO|nr:hypothetical protein DPMN_169249 [Dreissena polymorpha]KAH3797968.1 hypothetical protein DPMN_151558 [Dreissena polymorpha]KAH3879185.1 hypothetical protein DPMN_003087 [Dreissena polymorpha]KAH3894480.1 hypothetical protein DPMN_018637 [Dreissena polymorpha]KAH3897961.1 hypothetical protein DPMN_022157 [Dreissena polymorpha]